MKKAVKKAAKKPEMVVVRVKRKVFLDEPVMPGEEVEVSKTVAKKLQASNAVEVVL